MKHSIARGLRSRDEEPSKHANPYSLAVARLWKQQEDDRRAGVRVNEYRVVCSSGFILGKGVKVRP